MGDETSQPGAVTYEGLQSRLEELRENRDRLVQKMSRSETKIAALQQRGESVSSASSSTGVSSTDDELDAYMESMDMDLHRATLRSLQHQLDELDKEMRRTERLAGTLWFS